jgi:hypothetical protein
MTSERGLNLSGSTRNKLAEFSDNCKGRSGHETARVFLRLTATALFCALRNRETQKASIFKVLHIYDFSPNLVSNDVLPDLPLAVKEQHTVATFHFQQTLKFPTLKADTGRQEPR